MLGVRLINGIVDQVDAKHGRVKVRFAELDSIVSPWLAIGQINVSQNKGYSLYDKGEHVACMMDTYLESGYVLFAIYDANNPPPVTDSNKKYMRFSDGAHIEYDRNSGELTATGVTTVKVQAGTHVLLDSPTVNLTGNLSVDGTIDAQGAIRSATDCVSAGVSGKGHKHGGDSGGSTSGPA